MGETTGLRGVLDWESPGRPGDGSLARLRHRLKRMIVRIAPHQYVRYAPVVRHLEDRFAGRAPSVLEVGSGSLGVTRFWNRPVTGLDVRFDGPRLDYLTPVEASALDMPFADGSFETVISVDVLEHLSHHQRRAAIREMLRIASEDVLVGVPLAPLAEEADGWARRRCDRAAARATSDERRREIVGRSGFIGEHVASGYPTEAEMLSMLRAAAPRARVSSFGNESMAAWRFVLPAVVPLGPLGRSARTALALLAQPLLARSRAGGYYRRFFLVEKGTADGVPNGEPDA